MDTDRFPDFILCKPIYTAFIQSIDFLQNFWYKMDTDRFPVFILCKPIYTAFIQSICTALYTLDFNKKRNKKKPISYTRF